MRYNVTIDAEHEEKVCAWITAGRGIIVWRNQEIGGGAANEVYTPGDVGTPHWRYGDPDPVDLASLRINHLEILVQFRGRFKARYWGPDVADSTRKKADRITAKHEGASWNWTFDPDLAGYVQVRIVRDRLVPFMTVQTAE